jgi:hypothetical protein
MSTEPKKRFLITLKSIETRLPNNNTFTSLYGNDTKFLIDPITPYMWLPEHTLTNLEGSMRLKWDPVFQLYTLPPNAPSQLPDLYFHLYSPTCCSSTNRGSRALRLSNTTLVLNASFPLTNGTALNPVQYVPFKRGRYPGNDAYTLGRAFLQSTHIKADYETSIFSLAQARYDPADAAQLMGISKASVEPSKPAAATYPSFNEHLSALATSLVIAFSVVGVFGVGVVIYGIWAYRKGKPPFRHRRAKDKDGDDWDALRTAKAELDVTASASGSNSKVISSVVPSEISEVEGSSVPGELRGSPIVQVELDGDTPYYELDVRPRSINWNKREDPDVTVRRILAR